MSPGLDTRAPVAVRCGQRKIEAPEQCSGRRMSKPQLLPKRSFLNSNYFKPSFVLAVSHYDKIARSGKTAPGLDEQTSSAQVTDDCRFQKRAPLIHSAKAAPTVKLNARF